MKQLSLSCLALVITTAFLFAASGPDSEYASIYNVIVLADRLNASGSNELAVEQYQAARDRLNQLARIHPRWNPNIVKFRLKYIQRKLAPLVGDTSEVPSEEAIPSTIETPAPPTRSGAVVDRTPQIEALENKIANLEQSNERLNSRITVLDAQLKEALSAQPEMADAAAAVEARERARHLEKEVGILKAALDDTKQGDPRTESERVNELQSALKTAREEAAAAKDSLADANAKVEGLRRQVDSLTQQNQQLQSQLAGVSDNPEIKPLTQKIAELQERLNKANEKLYDNQTRIQLANIEQLTNQIALLRMKLDMYEARKTPAAGEEPAKRNEPGADSPNGAFVPDGGSRSRSRVGLSQLPPGAGPLVEAARVAFMAKRFDDAEENYLQALKLDEDNVYTLSNLALIQMEKGDAEGAEANLKKALAQNPEDAYSLSLLGILKMRQEKLDEALDALSKSATLDPGNPKTQNFLGVVLGQKGQSEAAEAALRKAVNINRNYADAHYNLAFVYAEQKPPSPELARWHYNKSVALGHERNAELESTIDKL